MIGVLLVLGVGSVAVAPAYADGPVWTIESASSPTNFAPGDQTGDDRYVLTVVDTGGSSASGSPVEIGDTLPSGLIASAISGEDLGNGQALSCKSTPKLGCGYEGFEMAPGDVLRIEITVKVSPGVSSSVVNSATVAGGGAEASASTEDPTTISSTGAGFGISDFVARWFGTQAGASVNLTTSLTFNHVVSDGETVPAADTKDVALNLPAGFVANPEATPRCSASDAAQGGCPASAAVGVAFISTSSGVGGAPVQSSSLLYNTAPAPGEFGALVLLLPSGPVWFGLTLRANGGYGLRLAASDLPAIEPLISMAMTLWGVPAAYDGAGPDHVASAGAPGFGGLGSAQPIRFLTSAGSCGALPDSTLSGDSWTAPSVFVEASSPTPAPTGCGRLPFDPSLSVASDVNAADEPSGYSLDLDIPQTEGAALLASSDLKDAAVTLPEGAGISLSATDGLLPCSEAQAALGSSVPMTCPDASKIGSVEVESPLSANPLEGAVYLATPSESLPGLPLAIYIVAENQLAGLSIKLAGQIDGDPLTGQPTIVLREVPQLPIDELRLHFFGGERALLSTPSSCGLTESSAEMTPWSASAAVEVSSFFDIKTGIDGMPCMQASPFSPTFQAGATAAGEADAYSSLALLVSRTDQEQELGKIAIQAPAAVAQMFAGVTPCGEPAASEARCSNASRVGTVAAHAGLGSDPASLSGAIYLTGPDGSSPQGLSIVLPVDPGPFELGAAVVRAGIQIDPVTGRISIESGQLPTLIDGVPLRLDALELQLAHGQFKINPGGCESLAVAGTITSTQGSSVPVSAEPLGASTSSCPQPQAPSPEGGGVSRETASVSLLATRIATTGHDIATVKLSCTGTVPVWAS
jgi:hypothetical protein